MVSRENINELKMPSVKTTENGLLSPVVVGLNGGGGNVGGGGGRTVGTALAPGLSGVPGTPGCSGRGGRRLVGGERPGVGGTGTLWTAAPLSRNEQKRTERARQSPRECPVTPHLQHRDSG
jgi:hypothetical protein